MSLSIKQLQARSRATYAPESLYSQDVLTMRCLVARHRATRQLTVTRIPLLSHTSSLASDLFALGVSASQAFGSYDAIVCQPAIGRNLSAQA